MSPLDGDGDTRRGCRVGLGPTLESGPEVGGSFSSVAAGWKSMYVCAHGAWAPKWARSRHWVLRRWWKRTRRMGQVHLERWDLVYPPSATARAASRCRASRPCPPRRPQPTFDPAGPPDTTVGNVRWRTRPKVMTSVSQPSHPSPFRRPPSPPAMLARRVALNPAARRAFVAPCAPRARMYTSTPPPSLVSVLPFKHTPEEARGRLMQIGLAATGEKTEKTKQRTFVVLLKKADVDKQAQ